VTAEERARAVDAERERITDRLEELRRRLAAAGLVLPELADLSGDLGDGVRGVALTDAGIARVAHHPGGAVVLYHAAGQIPLGDPEHALGHSRALAAALLAITARTQDR
jgi:hypothetical protein